MTESAQPNALTDDQIEQRLTADLPGWSYADGTIRRQFTTAGWKASVMACGAIAHLAELAWHHPDLEVSWGGVLVKLATHSAGGITELDFSLAKKIDEVLLWAPAEEGVLPGTPEDVRYSYIKRP